MEVLDVFTRLESDYEKLFEPQLAMHHQVSRNRIREWKQWDYDYMRWKVTGIPPQPGESHRDVLGIGSLSSGKNHLGYYKCLASSVLIPENYGCIVRKRWEEIENHILNDLYKAADTLFGGEEARRLIMSDAKTVGASKVITFQTPYMDAQGNHITSQIVLKPEPDKSEADLAEHWKGPEYGWVLFDEALDLTRTTWETLCNRLRRKFYVMFPRDYAQFEDSLPGDLAYDIWVQEQSAYLYWSLLITNPPYHGHWIDTVSTEMEKLERMGNLSVDDPIVVRSKMDDNLWTGEDYKRKTKRQYRNDPVKYAMLVEGRNGIKVDGIGVYSGKFRADLNVITPDEAEFNPFRPLLVGLDFGYQRPAALFYQADDDNRYTVFAELCPTEVDREELFILVHDEIKKRWPKLDADIFYYGDHAGNQINDSGISTIDKWEEMGATIFSQRMDLDDSLDIVRSMLTKFMGNPPEPRLRVVGDDCPILTLALAGGYYYKVSGTGKDPKPFKTTENHMDDVCDALRYGIVNAVGDSVAGANRKDRYLDPETGRLYRMKGM